MTESLDKQTERIVRQGVLACASSLVATLASVEAGIIAGRNGMRAARGPSDLSRLIDQAYELAAPVLDYEEAAREAGWKTADMTHGLVVNDGLVDDEGQAFSAEGWQEACELSGIEPCDREVYEHWIVTKDLAEDLIAVGEKVDTDFADLCVWARTTTGQMIAADACIQAVAKLRERRYREAMGEG